MRGSETLIPARFLSLISHLCVLITLLWESQLSAQYCIQNLSYNDQLVPIYHNRLVAGFGVAIALIVLELSSFMSGLTMFSISVSLISIAGHGSASMCLTYFVLDGWHCDWFWPIFALCSALPATVDVAALIHTLCSKKWKPKPKGTYIIRFQVTNEHQFLTKSHDYKPGWSLYLVLAGVITTLGSSLPVGYNIGVVNTPAEIIKRFCKASFASRYGVDLDDRWLNVLWSFVVSIFIVGGCTGSLMGAVLANNLGRKMATVVTNVLSLLGAVLFVLCREANSVEMLILGRLLVGLSGGLTTSIVPMYLSELAPPALSGAMGVACPMGVNVGVLVGQFMGLSFILGGVDDWPYLLSVYALLVIVCLPLLCILPESPKYLFVVRNNEEKALQELSRLRGESASILTEDIEQLRSERAASSETEALSLWSAVRDPRLQLALLLVCSMQAGQQTSGINAVFYYSQTIFQQAGLSTSQAQYATLGCGFINVCTAVFMIKLLPRFGRRPLLLGSILSAAIILAALAVSMIFINAVSWMPYVCMVAVLSYVLVYGFGLGPIPYFIASEMFEVSPRPAAMAWGSLANWGGNFLVGMSFPTMRELIGPYSFLVFSAITFALYVFQKFYFPETRGKTPAEISELCSDGFRSRPLADRQLRDV